MDLAFILDRFGPCPASTVCLGDLSGNQLRNQGDIIVLFSLWGPCFPNQTTRVNTFPPDPTTTTTTRTTTAPTTTTRTTVPLDTLAPTVTISVEPTTLYTTNPSITFSPQARTLSFDPPISSACTRVEPGAYLVYWSSRSDPAAENCQGDPQFLAIGNVENDYCFVNEYSTETNWFTDLTFLSCTVGRTALCAWTSTLNPRSSVFDSGLRYLCTTGSINGPPDETYNGTNLPSYQPAPVIPGNEFAHGPLTGGVNPQLNAPFQIGNCLKPTPRPPGAPYRSYRAYCSMDQIPMQWRSLQQSVGPFQH